MMIFPVRSFKHPILVLFFLTLFVFSCEYELPEKFTEVSNEFNPPELTFISMDMNTDTLYVCGPTRVSFTLLSSKQAVVGGSVTCLSKTVDFKGSGGSFDVNPDGFSDGLYVLELKGYIRSGTGSLADAAGAEGYMFTREFVLKIERPSVMKVKFLEPEIENGYLKIRWEKFTRPFFHSYEIVVNDSSLNNSYTRTILYPSVDYLIDSSFVGGSVTFTMYVSVKDCAGHPTKYYSDNKIYRFPVKLKFEESKDTLHISWTKIPFRHTVFMEQFSHETSLGIAESYKMRAPGLGSVLRYTFYFKPSVNLTWDHQRYRVSQDYTTGYNSAMQFYRMAYLPQRNIFLVKHPMFFRMYNGSFARLGTFDYPWDYEDEATIAASPDLTRLFTTSNQYIKQFNSSTFEVTDSKKFGPSETGDKRFRIMHILNDSLMYIGYNSTLSVYNYKTRKEVTKISMWDSNGSPYNTSISSDGKYVANCSNTYLAVYRNDNDSLVKILSQTASFYECIFDPVNTGNLLIITPTSSYVIHCPDMTTICTFPPEIRGMAVNFDPVTNDLLMVSYTTKKITVYDYVNNIIKFQCMHHADYHEFYLANGTVYHRNGYYLNSEYQFYEK